MEKHLTGPATALTAPRTATLTSGFGFDVKSAFVSQHVWQQRFDAVDPSLVKRRIEKYDVEPRAAGSGESYRIRAYDLHTLLSSQGECVGA